MQPRDAWKPVDGRVTNKNIFTNQASSGGKAATELITNMVDAYLMKRCYEEGIDSKGDQAPKTMYEAVDLFYENLSGGKIINADKNSLLRFAEKNMLIGITGSKKRAQSPCYTFADNGLGQHPQDFRDTFLSLSAKNKSDIPFVQGKYNMGSSGVHQYCGDKKYKLIISRYYDKSGPWGWTLVRQCPESEGDNVYLEYFSPEGKIPELSRSIDEIYPFQTQTPKEVYKHFYLKSGTIIKLYDFYAGKNHTDFKGAREALIENLVETVLPLRLLDFRNKPDKTKGKDRSLGIDPRPFYGMEYLLCRSHGDMTDDEGDEENKPKEIYHIKDPKLGEIRISALKLSKPPSWYNKSNARIFHHVNGQTMYKGMRGILSRTCKLPSLKDKVAIFVDSSNINPRERINIWKGDRENITDTHIGSKYKEVINNAIKGSAILKKWNHDFAEAERNKASEDSEKKAIQDIIKRDPNLRLLLDNKVPRGVSGGEEGNNIGEGTDSEYTGKYSPTYLRFLENVTKESKVIAINRGRPIPLETDVVDDYFTRQDNQGDYFFTQGGDEYDLIWEKFRVRRTLSSGRLTFFLEPSEGIRIGDEFRFGVALQDAAMPGPVVTREEVKVVIVEKSETDRPPTPPHPKHTSNLSLPRYVWLSKDGRNTECDEETTKWEDADIGFECNKVDGGLFKELDEEKSVCYINYDNIYFQNYLKTCKSKRQSEEIYKLGMRILLLGLEHGFGKQIEKGSDDKSLTDSQADAIDEIRRRAALGAASVVPTLCESIPEVFVTDDNDDDE